MQRFILGLLLLLAASIPARSGNLINSYADQYANALCRNESKGFCVDATIEGGAVSVKDIVTPANNLSNVKLNAFTWVDSKAAAQTGSNLTQSSTTPKFVDASSSPYVRSVPQNQFTQSQTLDNAAWSKTRVTVSANSTTAPDGTSTADSVIEDGTTNTRSIAPLSGGAFGTTGLTYNVSVYAKALGAGSTRYLQISGAGLSGASETVVFDVSGSGSYDLGATSTIAKSAAITNVGNGWFRCSVVILNGSSAAVPFFGLANDATTNSNDSYTGDSTSGLYLWGAQISQGAYLHPYHATVGSAWFGVPQGYDVADSKFGIQLEAAATNLITASESLNAASWSSIGNASVSADAATAPDGTSLADKLVEDTATAVHFVADPITTTSGTVYTGSTYAKAAGRNWTWFALGAGGFAGNPVCYFDLANGVIGTCTGASGTIKSAGSGWWRVTVTATSDASASSLFGPGTANADGGNSYLGDGSSGVYYWGAQVETGSVATSYIPTPGASTVTRNVDDVTALASSLPFQQNPGSLYADGRLYDNIASTNQAFWYLSDGSGSNNTVQLIKGSAAGDPLLFVSSGGATQASIDLGSASTSRMQWSASWDTNLVNGSLDGAAVTLDSSATMPSGMTEFQFGNGPALGAPMRGFFYRGAYVPRDVQTAGSNLSTWRYNQ